MADLIKVFLLSMAPVGELRLSIPIGVAVYHLNIAVVFLVAVAGNFLPAMSVLLIFKKIAPILSKKYKIFEFLFDKWGTKVLKRHSGKIQKYGVVGLALLVGVPLPFTGAYTGSLLAVLMELPFKKSVAAIFAGIVASGVIVSFLVIFGVNVQDHLWLQILLGISLIFSILYWYFRKRKRRKLNLANQPTKNNYE